MIVCKKLWYNAEVDLEGNFQPCSSFLGKVDGVPYDLGAYHSSTVLNHCISDQQRGIKNKECSMCWQQEAAGHRSLRQASEDFLPAITDQPRMLTLDYSLDHLCNLKCIMCSELASSSIMAEKIFLGLPVLPVTIKKDSVRLEFLDRHIESLQELKIYNSGEPFMSPLFEPMIDMIIKKNPDIKLMISTNATKVSDQILDKISQVKNLTLKVSIDGFKQVNDFIRFPSQWTVIEQNLIKLKKLDHAELVIHSTVQALNLYQINEFLTWTNSMAVDLELSSVKRSNQLDLCVIPEASRPIYQSRILSTLRNKNLNRANMRVMLAVLHQLENQPYCKQSHSELTAYLADLCRIRSINFKDYMPAEVELLQINI
jgi:sulfatase maturation enzyme AslB (radical SAM superfamily)